MTITEGEILGLTVAIVALAVGTAIICVRCCRSIARTNEAERVAQQLRHSQDQGFHLSYVETIRRSFRSLSFRRKPPAQQAVQIPRVHVATVEDLIKETSDIHPSYLEKKDSVNQNQDGTTNPAFDNSPYVPESEYHSLDESESSDGDHNDSATAIHGIENPMFMNKEGDGNDLCEDPAEFPNIDIPGEIPEKSSEQSSVHRPTIEASDNTDKDANSKSSESETKLSSTSVSEERYKKQSFPSAHFSGQMPRLSSLLGEDQAARSQNFPSAHFSEQMPRLSLAGVHVQMPEDILPPSKLDSKVTGTPVHDALVQDNGNHGDGGTHGDSGNHDNNGPNGNHGDDTEASVEKQHSDSYI